MKYYFLAAVAWARGFLSRNKYASTGWNCSCAVDGPEDLKTRKALFAENGWKPHRFWEKDNGKTIRLWKTPES